METSGDSAGSILNQGRTIIESIIQNLRPQATREEDPNSNEYPTCCDNVGLKDAYVKISGHIPGVTGYLPHRSEGTFLEDYWVHPDKPASVAALHQVGFQVSRGQADALIAIEKRAMQAGVEVFKTWLAQLAAHVGITVRVMVFQTLQSDSILADESLGDIHLMELPAGGQDKSQPANHGSRNKVVYIYWNPSKDAVHQLLRSKFYQVEDDEQAYKEFPISQLMGEGKPVKGDDGVQLRYTAREDPDSTWKYIVEDPFILSHDTKIWIKYKDRDDYLQPWRKLAEKGDLDGAVRELLKAVVQDEPRVQELFHLAKTAKSSSSKSSMTLDASFVDEAATLIQNNSHHGAPDKFLRLNLVGAEGAGKTLLGNAIIKANMPDKNRLDSLRHVPGYGPPRNNDPVFTCSSAVEASLQELEAQALQALFPGEHPEEDDASWQDAWDQRKHMKGKQFNDQKWLRNAFTTSSHSTAGCTAITQSATMSPDQRIFKWTVEFLSAIEVNRSKDRVTAYYRRIADHIKANGDSNSVTHAAEEDAGCILPTEHDLRIVMTLCKESLKACGIVDIDHLVDRNDYRKIEAVLDQLHVPVEYRALLGKKLESVHETSDPDAALKHMENLSRKFTVDTGAAAILKCVKLEMPGKSSMIIHDTPGITKQSWTHTESCLAHLRKAAQENVKAGFPVNVIIIPLLKRSLPSDLMELVFKDKEFMKHIIAAPGCFKIVPLLVPDNPSAGQFFDLDDCDDTSDEVRGQIQEILASEKFKEKFDAALTAAYKKHGPPDSLKQWLDTAHELQLLRPEAAILNTDKYIRTEEYQKRYSKVVQEYGLHCLLTRLQKEFEGDRQAFAMIPLGTMLKLYSYLSCMVDMIILDKESKQKVKTFLAAGANLMDRQQIRDSPQFSRFKDALAPPKELEATTARLKGAAADFGSDLEMRWESNFYKRRYGVGRPGLNADIKKVDKMLQDIHGGGAEAGASMKAEEHPAHPFITFLCGDIPGESCDSLVRMVSTTISTEIHRCKQRVLEERDVVLPLLNLDNPFRNSVHTAAAKVYQDIMLPRLQEHLFKRVSQKVVAALNKMQQDLEVDFYDACLREGLGKLLSEANTRRYRTNTKKVHFLLESQARLRSIFCRAVEEVMAGFRRGLDVICDQVSSSIHETLSALASQPLDLRSPKVNLFATATYFISKNLLDSGCCTTSTALFQKALQILKYPRVQKKLHTCRQVKPLSIQELVQQIDVIVKNEELRDLAHSKLSTQGAVSEGRDLVMEEAVPGWAGPQTNDGAAASTSSVPPQPMGAAAGGASAASAAQVPTNRGQQKCAGIKRVGEPCKRTTHLSIHPHAPSKTLLYCNKCREWFSRGKPPQKRGQSTTTPPGKRAKIHHPTQ